MIPCIENKCILYPLCINKPTIYCYDLYKCFNQLKEQGVSNKDTWNMIHKNLRATLIYPDDKPKDPKTTLLRSQKYPTHLYDNHIECSK